MNTIAQFLIQHAATFGDGAALSLITAAVIQEWPKDVPRSIQDWWSWARNTSQQIMSMKRGNPTQPAEPAKENQ